MAPPFEVETQVHSSSGSKLTQRAYLNAVAATLDYAATAVVALVINPILVAGLGGNIYGVLQVLQRLMTFMTAADGRPTQALKWAIANQQGSDDHTAKQRSIGSAIVVWLVFLPVLVGVGGALVWLSPHITKVSAELSPLIRVTSALLVVQMLLFGIVTLPEAVLRGMNLGYKRMALKPCVTILGGILTAGAVYFGFGLVGVVAVLPLGSVVAAILYWGTVRRYIPWFGVIRPTLAGTRSFFSFSGWFFAWTLVNKVLLSGDVVVLGMVATAESVTIYTLTGYVARMVVGLMAVVFGAITPGMGGLIGKKQYSEAMAVRGDMMTVNWLLTVSVGVSILLWNRSFTNLWVGMVHYAGPLANFLIVLVVTQLTFIRTDAFTIDLTLDLRRKVLLGGLSTLLSLGLAAILIRPLGIVGLCLGLIIGRSILTVSFPLLVSSALEGSLDIRLGDLVRPAAVMSGAFILSGYLGQRLLASNWIEFFTFASLTFVLALCVAFVSGLTSRQRRVMVSRFGEVRLLGGA